MDVHILFTACYAVNVVSNYRIVKIIDAYYAVIKQCIRRMACLSEAYFFSV